MLAPGPALAPAPIPGEPESLSRGLNLPLTAPVGRDDLRIWAAVFPLPFNSVLACPFPFPFERPWVLPPMEESEEERGPPRVGKSSSLGMRCSAPV